MGNNKKKKKTQLRQIKQIFIFSFAFIFIFFAKESWGVTVQEVSAGEYHTCALLSDNTVKCWGSNDRGQLGDGTTNINHNLPVLVSGINNAAGISVGDFHSCAILYDGTIKCWGSGSNVPVTVPGITNAISVSAGSSHTCALLSNNTVKCWGSNYYGQLGDGTNNNSNVPVTVQGNTFTIIRSISAGGSHTCALLFDGTVQCWGSNYYGQLGDGTNTSSNVPVFVSGISLATITATSISAGVEHTCASLYDGSIKCWGYGVLGGLGNGSNINSNIPVCVSGITNTTPNISAGYYHTCALLFDGSVQCWGWNKYGQLGNGTNTGPEYCDINVCSTIPVLVSGINTATNVTAGHSHSCAVVSNGTEVKCWGRDWYGELGDGGTAVTSNVPITVIDLFADNNPPITSVTALPTYTNTRTFVVSWSGSDIGGSGFKCYDVQYKVGSAGTWTDWQSCVTITSATFGYDANPHIILTDGTTYYFQSRGQDNAGNTESYPGGNGDTNTTIDLTLPTSTITAPANGAGINGTTYTITGTANDGAGSGVDKVEISTDGGTTWNLALGTTNWSYSWAISNGSYTIKSRAIDNAGNVEEPGNEIAVIVDNTAPICSITAPANGAMINGTTYTITGTTGDGAGSGVNKVEISTDDGATWNLALGTVSWSYSWTLSDGGYTIKSRATDNAGNVEVCEVAVVVDNTAPISSITAPANGANINGITYTVTGTASDGAGSGVNKVEVSTDDGISWNLASGTTSWSYIWTLPADGTYQPIKSRAIDNTGNVEVPGALVTVTVDNTAPISSITAPANGAMINNGTTYTITGTTTSDGIGSGVNKVEVSTDGGTTWNLASGTTSWSYIWTLPAYGTYTIKSRVTDNAGNVEVPGDGVTVTVDNIPPTSFITAPANGAMINNGTIYTITGIASDGAGSGVNKVEVSTDGGTIWNLASGTTNWSYSWTLSDGTYTIKSRVTDNAGNVEIPGDGVAVTVDNTVPISSITAPANGAMVIGTTYTITGTASDGVGSGVNKVEISTDGGIIWNLASGTTNWSYHWTLPADGTYTIKSRATDNAGNVEVLITIINVTVDNTNPTGQITQANFSNFTRPGATNIVIGEQFKLTAIGDPNQSNITGVIANANRLGQMDAIIGAQFPLTENSAGSGNYEYIGTFTTATDNGSNVVSKLAGAASNNNFTNNVIVAAERLTVVSTPIPQITTSHLTNISRVGATDIIIGEGFKLTATGDANQTNVIDVLANADRLGQPDAGIGGFFNLTENPVGSGNYEYTAILSTVIDNGGNTATKIIGAVSSDNFNTVIVLTPEQLTVSAGVPAIAITSIVPNAGENTGIISTTINGNNFQNGITAKLQKTGQLDINGVVTSFINSTTIQVDFNLAGAVTGSWDVVVTNPDLQSVVLVSGFTVTSPPQITQTHLTNISRVGATDIQIGEQFKITATVTPNQTNVKAVIANLGRLGQPDAVIGSIFLLTENPIGSGLYDSGNTTLTTNRDWGGFIANSITAAVSNDNFNNVIVSPEILTVGVAPIGPPDLSISKWVTGPRPGFDENYQIFYFNNTTGTAINVKVTDTLPPTVTYISSNPAGTYNAGTNTVTWNLGNILGLSVDSIKIKVNIPPLTLLGSKLVDKTEITTTSSDSDLSNNVYTLNSTVVGSWDPNDKEVSPVGYITNEETLFYVIHFENEGTAPAVNIKVEDTLDANLDEATLKDISNAGNFNPQTRTLSWQLDNINLPPQGEGYVYFRIKPKTNLPIGTVVSNKAQIVFDFNPPIDTPVVTNTIGIPLPVAEITTPTANQFINTNTLNIYGSAFGLRYNQFNHYELQYGSGSNPVSWTQITTSQTEVLSNKLATWNITNLSGEYTLRLKAYNQTQNYAESKIKLFINLPPQITTISGKDKFKEPIDVAFDKDNNLYVLDKDNKQPVKKVNLTTNNVTSLINQKIEDAKKIVVDNQGTIYLLTEKNVLIFDPSGTLAYTLPITQKGVDLAIDTEKLYLLTSKGESSQVTIYGDSPQPIAQWTVPEQLTSITANYFIYLSSKKEQQNFIKVYTQDGELVANFGSGFKDNENHIVSIDIDNNFNLYALDKESKNDAIRGYNTDQQLYFIYGAKGEGTGSFKEPTGLAVTTDGKYLAIADTENKRVQVIKFIPATNNQQIVKTKEDSALTLTKIQILPNPITGTTKTGAKLLVDAQGNIINANIEIYNTNGNKILSTPVFSTQLGKGKYKLSSPEVETKFFTLPNGVYFCRVTLSDGINEVSKVGKIVILK